MGGGSSKSKQSIAQFKRETIPQQINQEHDFDRDTRIETLEIIRKCLKSLPKRRGGEIKTISLMALAQEAEIKNYERGEIILKRGDSGSGFYIILEGEAVAMSTDDNTIIANIGQTDYFGDISVFYNTQVTLTVMASCSMKTLFLPKDVVNDIYGEVDKDELDWHVQRRYIPMSNSVDAGKTWRRMTLDTLKRLAIFAKWSENALKALILSLDEELAILYEAASTIQLEDDVFQSVYIILRGSVDVVYSGQTITIDCREQGPFIVGEEVFFGGASSGISVKTNTCCIVLQLARQYIEDVREKHPKETPLPMEANFQNWKRKFQNESTDKKSAWPLFVPFQIILTLFLKNPIFKECPHRFLYSLIFDGEMLERHLGESLYDEDDTGSLLVLLDGHGQWRNISEEDKDVPNDSMDIPVGFMQCLNDYNNVKKSGVAASHCTLFRIPSKSIDQVRNSPECKLKFPSP